MMNTETDTIVRDLLAVRIAKQQRAVEMLREASCLVSCVAIECNANQFSEARALSDTVHTAYVAAKDTLALLTQAADSAAIRATLTLGDL